MDSESHGSIKHAFNALFQALRENCQDITDLRLHIPSRCDPRTIRDSIDFAIPDFQIEDDILIRAGQALQGNTFVQDLRINVDNVTLAGVRYISRFIAASPTISRLYILSDHGETQDRLPESTAAVHTLLMAASINYRISTLSLSLFVGAKHMTICLHGMKNSLVSLELNVLGLHTRSTVHERTMEAAEMGMAVASLLALKELAISCCCDNISSCFLDHLGPVLPHLRKLMVSTHPLFQDKIQDEFIDAIQRNLLQSVLLETLYVDLDHNLLELGQNISDVQLLNSVLQQVGSHPSIREYRSNIVCGDEHILHVVNLIENNSSVLEEIQIVCENLPCAYQAASALEANTMIKSFELEVCGDEVEDADEEIQGRQFLDDDMRRSIEYYTTRNIFTPALEVASKAEMVEIFRTLSNTRSEGISVIFDTLRVRDNWYE